MSKAVGTKPGKRKHKGPLVSRKAEIDPIVDPLVINPVSTNITADSTVERVTTCTNDGHYLSKKRAAFILQQCDSNYLLHPIYTTMQTCHVPVRGV